MVLQKLSNLVGRRQTEEKAEPAAPEGVSPVPPGTVFVQELWDALRIGNTWHRIYQLIPTGWVEFGYVTPLLLNPSLFLKGRAAWVCVEIGPGEFSFDWSTKMRLKRIEVTAVAETAEIGQLTDDREFEAAKALRELWDAYRSGQPLTRWRILAGVQAPTYEAVKRAGEELVAQADAMGMEVRLLTGEQWLYYQRVGLGFDPTRPVLPKGRVAPLETSACLIPVMGSGISDVKSADGQPLIYVGHRLADGRRLRIDLLSGVHDSNMIICGKTGTGKSYFMKALIQSLRQAGLRIVVLDLDGEGRAQCEALGGTWMDLSAATGRYIDPLILPPPVEIPDWMTKRDRESIHQWNLERLPKAVESVMGFLSILLNRRWTDTPEIQSIAHESIMLTLQRAGIDPDDQSTWNRPCSMRMWWEVFKEYVEHSSDDMVKKHGHLMRSLLNRYFEGRLALFREPISLEDADALWIHMAGAMGQTLGDEEATSAKMQLALTTLWAITVQERVRGTRYTALFFDEGQRLLTNPQAAATVASLVTGVRKFNAMTVLATNMPNVFWHNEGGRAAWQNSSFRVLFGLDSHALMEIRKENQIESKIPNHVLERLARFGIRGTQLAHAFMFYHPAKGWDEAQLNLPAEEAALYGTRGNGSEAQEEEGEAE